MNLSELPTLFLTQVKHLLKINSVYIFVSFPVNISLMSIIHVVFFKLLPQL